MRIHFFAPSIILFSVATFSLPGCFTVGDDDAPSDDDDSCSSDADCLNGQSCQNDRCVANTGSGGTGGSTGGSGGKGGSGGGSGGKGGSGGGGGTESGNGGDGGSTMGGTGGSEAGMGGTDGGVGGSTGGSGGVSGQGGSSAGVGGSSGSSATTTPAKFCNALSNGGVAVELTFEIGDVALTALTGACAPDNACIGVPTGIDVPVALSDDSGVVSSGTYPEVPAGEEMVFFSAIDVEASLPTIHGFPGNGICSSPDVYAGTVAKFCNKLTSGGASVTLTLDLGGATVSAATGECTPLDMCLPIASGTDVPIALLDDNGTVVTSGTFPSVPAGSSMLFQAEIDDTAGGPTITGGPYTGICGAVGEGDARRIEANGAPKSANLDFVSANATLREVAADSLILDAAMLGVAAGSRRFVAR